jgi:hypothetical protein
MKTPSKQQIAYEALFDEAAVFEDEDVCEILEENAETAREAYLEARYKKMMEDCSERYILYFLAGECLEHSREVCAECSSYARGICPYTKEESGLPHHLHFLC